MNLDNIDLAALQRDLEDFAREQQQRSWWKRNCLWFVPTLLVVLILLGGGGVYWALFTRVYKLDVYQSAMQKVAADGAVRRELGSPVTTATWPPPSARVEASETDVRWPIEGPDGRAKAHVLAKLMQGKWETIQLEVILADEKRLLITSGDASEADAPTFVAPKTKPPTQDAAPNMPAPEINLAPPTDDGPPK